MSRQIKISGVKTEVLINMDPGNINQNLTFQTLVDIYQQSLGKHIRNNGKIMWEMGFNKSCFRKRGECASGHGEQRRRRENKVRVEG